MVPDGCFENAFIDGAGAANLNGRAYITFGGVPPAMLTGKGAEFYESYKKKYNAEPEAYAVYGYEAAKVALDGIATRRQEGPRRDPRGHRRDQGLRRRARHLVVRRERRHHAHHHERQHRQGRQVRVREGAGAGAVAAAAHRDRRPVATACEVASACASSFDRRRRAASDEQLARSSSSSSSPGCPTA